MAENFFNRTNDLPTIKKGLPKISKVMPKFKLDNIEGGQLFEETNDVGIDSLTETIINHLG